jgi:ABC-type Fe3+ transport system, permease component
LLDDDFWSLAQNSLTLAGIAAGIGSAIALVLAYLQRNFAFMQVAVRLSAMGYGVPGAVIAVGIMVPFGWVDQQGYRARIRNHGHSCFLCEIVIRSQFHTTYEPEA